MKKSKLGAEIAALRKQIVELHNELSDKERDEAQRAISVMSKPQLLALVEFTFQMLSGGYTEATLLEEFHQTLLEEFHQTMEEQEEEEAI